MKQLYLKQQVFSITNQFKVYDDQQKVMYECKGEFFSIRREIKIYRSADKTLVYSLQKRILSFLHAYFLKDATGQVVARLEQKFSFFGPKFKVYYQNQELELKGNLWGFDYTVFSNGIQLIQVHKKWLSWGDTYEILVDEKFNLDLAVAMVVMIDDYLAVNAQNQERH
jgi:uncharacterized protein YxjI